MTLIKFCLKHVSNQGIPYACLNSKHLVLFYCFCSYVLILTLYLLSQAEYKEETDINERSKAGAIQDLSPSTSSSRPKRRLEEAAKSPISRTALPNDHRPAVPHVVTNIISKLLKVGIILITLNPLYCKVEFHFRKKEKENFMRNRG